MIYSTETFEIKIQAHFSIEIMYNDHNVELHYLYSHTADPAYHTNPSPREKKTKLNTKLSKYPCKMHPIFALNSQELSPKFRHRERTRFVIIE